MGDGLVLGLHLESHAALLSNGRGVNEGDLLVQHTGEGAAQGSQAERVDGLAGELAAGGNHHGRRSTIQQLGGNRTQLRGQVQPQGDLLGDLATGDVDGIRDEVASQGLEDGGGDVGACAILRLNGRCTKVRGHDDLVELEQRGIRARLGGVDVEACATDVAGLNGIGESLLVDEATAGSVDDDLPLLGLRQEVSVEHTAGLRGFRQVDRHEVRAAHELIELNELHAEPRGARRVGVRIIGDDLGLESGEMLGEQLADVAEAHDADGLTEDFHP